ncbi:SMI1/KNR4 family protein [Loigolactobacillus jiayinensis]|uniref:SMI1/KNR4 family protein n=1 Tax=Loigolactobacillus jiayinensis TaxID=2486016 RepID=A0ABW1R8M8_9LACO|nr:SMI1/KNR4 family protein [Loigolactobacillus jiayinensis]
MTQDKRIDKLVQELTNFENKKFVYYRWSGTQFTPTHFRLSIGITELQQSQLRAMALPSDYIDLLMLTNGIKLFEDINSKSIFAGSLLSFDEVLTNNGFFEKHRDFVKEGNIPVFQIQDIGLVLINTNKSKDDTIVFVLPDDSEKEMSMYSFLNEFLLYAGNIPSVSWMD